jgi:hypothetical protein
MVFLYVLEAPDHGLDFGSDIAVLYQPFRVKSVARLTQGVDLSGNVSLRQQCLRPQPEASSMRRRARAAWPQLTHAPISFKLTTMNLCDPKSSNVYLMLPLVKEGVRIDTW